MNSRASGLWVGVAMVLFAACGETPASLCKEDNPTSVLRSLRALELPQSSFAVGIWSFENDSDDFLGQVERLRGFRGHLAELGLWSEALTDAEIQSLHSRSIQK